MIKFKVYFKDLDKKVLVNSSFDKYQWNKLRDAIIQSSKRPEYKNRELKDRDDFILELHELPESFKSPLTSIWNTKTYNYFVENLKLFKEKNPNVEIKTIKLKIVKVDKLPKWDVPKYDALLRNILENTWKIESEKIKNELNNSELEKGCNNFIRNKFQDTSDDKLIEMKNNNIICNSCLSINFMGYRYVCAHCNNFNLCQKCFYLGNHDPEHNFLLFKSPLNDDNTSQYNNKFSSSTIVVQNNYDSFEVKFKIANTGEQNLKGCYLAYIKFTGNYLWCKKYIITENFEKKEIKDINLQINFGDTKNKNGIFEGQFRMFSQLGIPFGDILKVRVKNDKL